MSNKFQLSSYEKAIILEMHNRENRYTINEQLDTTENIKKFQDWMDTIGVWVKNSNGKYVKLLKGPGYGTAGTSTKAAWKAYGIRYYKEVLGIDVTPDDFDKISEEEVDVDVVTQGNVTTTTTKGCVNAKVSGTFGVNVSSNSKNLEIFKQSVLATIEKSQILKSALAAKTLSLNSISLIGGASNYYGGAVKPELDNNRNPISPAAGTYKGNSTANKTLATNRAKNLWTQIKTFLPSMGITISPSVKPTFEGYNVDTGGKNDNKRDRATYKNPGQFVMTTFGFCGVNTTTTTLTKPEFENCYQGIEIEVNFDGSVRNALKGKSGAWPDLKFHNCNAAVFEIFANGQQLTDSKGLTYADLNNFGTANAEDPKSMNGIDKFAKFILNSETNKDKIQQMWQDAQSRKDYTGDINISLRCGPSDKIGKDRNSSSYGGGCHKGVGHVIVRNNGAEVANVIQGTPQGLGEVVAMNPIQACKPTQKTP